MAITAFKVAALVALPAVVVFGPLDHFHQQERPSFAGTWKLNPEETTPLKERVEHDPERVGGGAAVGLGPKGRGATDMASGGASRSGAGAGRGPLTISARVVRDLMRAPATLIIQQTDSSIVIDPGIGIIVNAPTNGRAVDTTVADGTKHRTRVSWKRKDLVVERDFNIAGSIRETYRLVGENPRRLVVEFHFENKAQRRTADQKRVYDPANPE
ncbi:MAG TPA: hypothetical protein VNL96_06835 [Gemmatimonadaceae bacterium]|nr:hypothetical protein [Gemmatimonadaceae bacterium]